MLIIHDNARNINFVTIFKFLLFKTYRFAVKPWRSVFVPTAVYMNDEVALRTFRHYSNLVFLALPRLLSP